MPRRRQATIYAGRPISAPAVAKPQHCGSFRAPTTRPSAGSDTNHVRCRGAKSFVDDLGHSRGVVLSRAVHFCDLLRLSPLTGRFVRFRRTRLRSFFFCVLSRGYGAVYADRSIDRSIDTFCKSLLDGYGAVHRLASLQSVDGGYGAVHFGLRCGTHSVTVRYIARNSTTFG